MRRLHLSSTMRRALVAAAAAVGCHTAPPYPANPAPRRDSVDVGYAVEARRDVTGAVASVNGDVAQRNTPISVADMLDGRFAGVEVHALAGGGISVRIRGSRSLKSDGEPLFVVDGIPQHGTSDGAIRDIDPKDVRSIEVLKDAGATAAYGARGANGVILITTQRAH